jgi:twitching motility protein PilI
MNDMVPDISSFLADMPLLEGESATDAVAQTAADSAPQAAAENVIPDSTDFLMDGFAVAGDGALPDAGIEHPVESPQVVASAELAPAPDFFSQPGLLQPSVALGSSPVDLREGLAGTWGVDRNRTLSAKLGFHVGDLRFVVSFDDASELSEMVSVYRLPNLPSWFRGLANLHGNLVPVFDLAAMIGSQVGADQERMLLVLGHGSMAAGMLVNELPTRVRLESATAIDLPELPDQLKDCVTRAYLHGEEIWLELQYQRFFEATAARLGQ